MNVMKLNNFFKTILLFKANTLGKKILINHQQNLVFLKKNYLVV